MSWLRVRRPETTVSRRLVSSPSVVLLGMSVMVSTPLFATSRLATSRLATSRLATSRLATSALEARSHGAVQTIPSTRVVSGASVIVPASEVGEQPTHGATARVSLTVRDSSVEFVVNALARQARLQVVYKSSPALSTRISVHLVDVNVMDALAEALKGTGLIAKLAADGETVVIRNASSSSAEDRTRAAEGIVTGRVTDSASGRGVANATVGIRGTKLTTTTSDSGYFTLPHVPAGNQIVTVRAFGFRPASAGVSVVDGERSTVHVILASTPAILSGVVTTAAGVQRRLEVGNDIAVINADSVLRIAPVTNITQMLATRVPGLVVTNTSGIPGAPSRLRLRGMSSVENSDDPIVIVDGVRIYANQSGTYYPQSGVSENAGSAVNGRVSSVNGIPMAYAGPSALDQIDPNSVETIEVLKGPSASALYGSDAANGVIVITTKRGKAGPTRLTASADLGRTTLPGSWPLNYFQFGHAIALNNNGSYICALSDGPAFCTPDSTVAYQALNSSRYSPLGTGWTRDGNVNVSGGTGPLTYSVTATASLQGGYLHLPDIEAQRFEKFHGFDAPDWMRNPDHYGTWGGTSQLMVQLGQAGTNLSLANSLFRSSQQQSSLQTALSQLQNRYIDTAQLDVNPLIGEYYERAQLNSLSFTTAVTLNQWMPFHWLPINATAGLNVLTSDNNSITPRDYLLGRADSLGEYVVAHGTNMSQTLNVSTTLVQRYLSTAIGINVIGSSLTSLGSNAIGLPIGVTVPTVLGCNAPTGCTSQSSVNTATYGWYVQPTINLNSRLFISPGIRLDGGNSSGSNAELTLFPKIDVSWVALDRTEHPLFGALTLLRPRLAFGIAGVQPSPADKLRLFIPGTVVPVLSDGSGVPISTVSLNSLGNTELKPERSRELEGGFDAEFWDQRLTLTLTGYQKMRYDAIIAIPVAPSVGANNENIQKNVGTIRNTGIEGSVSARIVDGPSLGWSMNANISHNDNSVVRLNNGVASILMSTNGRTQSIIRPGYSLNSIWARPILSYADVNGDGVIEAGEVRLGDSAVYLGSPGPNYELSLGTTLSILNGRLSLTTGVDYMDGVTQVNLTGFSSGQANSPSAPQSAQAAVAVLNETGYGLVQTVNALRWTSLSLNYIVPQTVARLFRAPNMSLALQGSNLGLHTNYHGKDPDVNAYSNGNQTADTGQLPQPRVWSLRVTLGN